MAITKCSNGSVINLCARGLLIYTFRHCMKKLDWGLHNESKERMTTTKDFTPVGSKEEREFLEGPRSRWKELRFLMKVMLEFFYGFRKLHFTGPCVTVFGSARFDENHPYYILSRQMGQEIARLGFTVITGGGPGIMEAANRGAKDVGGISIGCNIILPKEQHP